MIVVLAVILVIAVPKILDVIKSSRENSLISSVKLVARNAEQKKLASEVIGESTTIDCSEVADLSSNDYASCEITFDEEGNATVSITGKGKFSGYTCSGTKSNVTCGEGTLTCAANEENNGEGNCKCKYGYEYTTYYVPVDKQDLCYKYLFEDNDFDSGAGSGHACLNETETGYGSSQEILQKIIETNNIKIEDLLIENGENGFLEIIENDCSNYNYLAHNWREQIDGDVVSITFHKTSDGFSGSIKDISQGRTGKILLYVEPTGEENNVDVHIVSNEKIYFPVNSQDLFSNGELRFINFNDSIDTSQVENMSNMFYNCINLEEIDLSSFDTSKVTDMSWMFNGCNSEIIIYIGENWTTSNVSESNGMFGDWNLSYDKLLAHTGDGGYLTCKDGHTCN